MKSLELKKLVVKTLQEYKGQEIVALDITKLTDIAEFMVICTGTSNRHIKTMADHLVTVSKQASIMPLGVEEDPSGAWTLVDLNNVIIHIMLPETRKLYALEDLWSINIAHENRNNSAR